MDLYIIMIGVLMMTPMVFGGLTMYYSIVAIEEETKKRWIKYE